MRRRDLKALFVLFGLLAGPGTEAQQPSSKTVAVLMQGGAYRAGYEGLKEVLEAELPAGSFRLLVQDGRGDLNVLKTAAASSSAAALMCWSR